VPGEREHVAADRPFRRSRAETEHRVTECHGVRTAVRFPRDGLQSVGRFVDPGGIVAGDAAPGVRRQTELPGTERRSGKLCPQPAVVGALRRGTVVCDRLPETAGAVGPVAGELRATAAAPSEQDQDTELPSHRGILSAIAR
jgi:hypothetical protein